MQGKTLLDSRERFLSLCIEDKCKLLAEILHLFQCQSGAANLSLVGGPGHAGTIKINNNISNVNSIYIINQSPTGIYEQEIDLKRV